VCNDDVAKGSVRQLPKCMVCGMFRLRIIMSFLKEIGCFRWELSP